MSSRAKSSNLLVVVACLAAATAAACAAKPDDSDPRHGVAAQHDSTGRGVTLSDSQRARLTIVEVASSSYVPQLEVTGNVAFNGDHSTQVIAQVSGPVTRILVQPGARVKEGDALAYVSSPDFATAIADYRKADAAWRNAKRIADRNEQLFAADALARTDLDQARSDLSAAAADLEASTQQLRALGVAQATIDAVRDGKETGVLQGTIRAPLSGTVVERLVTPGMVVEAGATVAFTVADLSSMWVFANVFESDLAAVGAGERADIYTGASVTPLHGRVDYVAALVDPGSKATAVRVVATNTPPLLKKDMLVRVVLHGLRETTGLLLPDAAVLRDAENLPFVFIAAGDGRFVRKRVELGSHLGNRYEIRSGLAIGDKVVADGAIFVDFSESQ
ncbi:MAG: efflux RND transporter periplasmic adaptor subunit [Gemmatimonadota bacterium]